MCNDFLLLDFSMAVPYKSCNKVISIESAIIMFPIKMFEKAVFHNENAKQKSNMQFEDVIPDFKFQRIVWMTAIQIFLY
jgi:hypothetical protein